MKFILCVCFFLIFGLYLFIFPPAVPRYLTVKNNESILKKKKKKRRIKKNKSLFLKRIFHKYSLTKSCKNTSIYYFVYI